MYCKPLVRAILIGFGLSATQPLLAANNPNDTDTLAAQVAVPQAQIDALQRQLNELKHSTKPPVEHFAHQQDGGGESPPLSAVNTAAEESEPPHESSLGTANEGVHLGGAVRWQFSHEGYDSDNKRRNGDIDFDIFRLDLDGFIGDITLSAQYRLFQWNLQLQAAQYAHRLNDVADRVAVGAYGFYDTIAARAQLQRQPGLPTARVLGACQQPDLL